MHIKQILPLAALFATGTGITTQSPLFVPESERVDIW